MTTQIEREAARDRFNAAAADMVSIFITAGRAPDDAIGTLLLATMHSALQHPEWARGWVVSTMEYEPGAELSMAYVEAFPLELRHD